MSLRYQAFTMLSDASKQKFDAGIESNQAEPKKLIGMLVHVTAQVGNRIQIYLDNEKLADIYDYHFDTVAVTGADTFPYSQSKLQKIDLEIDIPIGQRVKACIQCGGTLKTMYGSYIYEVPE